MLTLLAILTQAGGWKPGLYLKIDNPRSSEFPYNVCTPDLKRPSPHAPFLTQMMFGTSVDELDRDTFTTQASSHALPALRAATLPGAPYCA